MMKTMMTMKMRRILKSKKRVTITEAIRMIFMAKMEVQPGNINSIFSNTIIKTIIDSLRLAPFRYQ